MALKSPFLQQNRKNHLTAGGSVPFVTRLNCNGLFITGHKLDNFCAKTFMFGLSPISLCKTLVALLVVFTPADRFFKRLYGPHTKRANKCCRAYMSLFSKMNTRLYGFKISVFMCKSSVYFIVLPSFLASAPHFVWSGDGTAVSVWLSRSCSIYRN